ncbi:MAG: hypothetical protein OEV00_10420 [Acidobacteriota bacterium]|nr:hypothetical protein [Acidobacteriota bacterium]MDH3785725.1 hypothetical protein [Acidobacteriota bacterium]
MSHRMRSHRLVLSVTVALLLLGSTTIGADNTNWFVSFERVQVPPVERSDTTQLVDAGTIQTDGFSELVFSLGGEFKEGIPESGKVGVILIPDMPVFTELLRTEGEFIFPLEASVDIRGLSSAIFISDQQTAKVAFPRYRVYVYNETTSGAMVSLFVYRTR